MNHDIDGIRAWLNQRVRFLKAWIRRVANHDGPAPVLHLNAIRLAWSDVLRLQLRIWGFVVQATHEYPTFLPFWDGAGQPITRAGYYWQVEKQSSPLSTTIPF